MTTRLACLASTALLLAACPSTATCDPGLMWNGSMCVPQDGGIDTGMGDGGSDAWGHRPLQRDVRRTTLFCRTSTTCA
jgi:hypothetical protein